MMYNKPHKLLILEYMSRGRLGEKKFLEFLDKKSLSVIPLADDILVVCAALCNLQGPLIV